MRNMTYKIQCFSCSGNRANSVSLVGQYGRKNKNHYMIHIWTQLSLGILYIPIFKHKNAFYRKRQFPTSFSSSKFAFFRGRKQLKIIFIILHTWESVSKEKTSIRQKLGKLSPHITISVTNFEFYYNRNQYNTCIFSVTFFKLHWNCDHLKLLT